MTPQTVESITEEYYSHFCLTELSGLKPGTYLVCSAGRDEYLRAYGCKYTIWLLIRDGLCAAAYSPKYGELFDSLRGMGGQELLSSLSKRFRMKKMKLMTFGEEKVRSFGGARALTPGDYPLYEAFFMQTHPGAEPGGWLKDYFIEKARGCFTGYLSDGKLLSVCDLPDMPYMQGRIQHTGIMTLEGQRRKGYALRAAALAAHNLLERGICPQWECRAENIASVGLAEAIGYREYGTAYILEE